MRSEFKIKNDQFLRRLRKVNHGKVKQNQNYLKQTIGHPIQSSNQDKSKKLKQIYLKVKVQSLVKQFVQKLKRYAKFPVPKQYQIIQNSLRIKQQNNNYFKTISLSNSLKCFFIILNNVCVLLLQTISIFQGFFADFRESQSQSWPIISLKSLCMSIFLIKIIISSISEKVATQRVMYILRDLVKFYMFSWSFFFDFLLCVLTFLILLHPTSQTLGIITFLGSFFCFFAFSNNFEIIQVVYINNLKKKQYWDLLKILVFDIFFTQFIVSIFVAMSFYDPNKNWILKAVDNGIINPDHRWWEVYIYAYYWAITTITSVGYGDITQGNYFQAVVVVIVMLIGYLILAYNVSQIWNIASNLRKIDEQKKLDSAIFKRMVIDQKVNQKISEKILNYINSIASIKSQYEFIQRKMLLQKLPFKLRQQYQQQASKNIFSKIPFFKFLHFDTLIALAQNIERTIYYPGQYLTHKIQKLTCLMILKHGQIGYAYCKADSQINGLILQTRKIDKEVDDPYLLNKYLLARHKQINYHIIAKSYCFLYMMSFQKLKSCLRLNQLDNQFYFKLSNKLTFIDQQWDKFQCEYCAPRRHSIFRCPRLHFMPFESLVISKYLNIKSKPCKRKENFNRKKIKLSRKHTLLLKKRYFKEFEKNWEIFQNREKMKRIFQTQNNTAKNQFQSEKKQYIQMQKNTNFLKNISQQLSQNKFKIETEYQIEVQQFLDKLHNFSSFFPQDNSNKLIWTLLNKKVPLKKRIALNQTKFSLLF